MIFQKLKLHGAYLITPERLVDERGFFARIWCQREFEQQGLDPRLVQCSLSFNRAKGTFRGMHYQESPYAEAKLVRCTRGEICDIIVDLRPDSPSFGESLMVILSAENRNMLYIPEGFAHGFITLDDNTEVFYQMTAVHSPAHARGFRWNDPAFDIRLPLPISVISDRDRSYPDFEVRR